MIFNETTIKKKISIIVATFNSSSTVRIALDSIIQQKSDDVELIVVDGGSTDGTINILRSYSNFIDVLVSEKDNGIYDAWNKGIKRSSGDFISFIGSDDELENNYIETYSKFLDPKFDLICSNVKVVVRNHTRIVGSMWSSSIQIRKMSIAHVGSMHNRRLFMDFGLFDDAYKIAGDFEFLLRIRNHIHSFYIPLVTVKMGAGGVSNRNFISVLLETRKAILKNTNRKLIFVNFDFMIALIKALLRNLIYKCF